MQFSKLHGLGNDFILVDLREASTKITAELAQRLCDRHRGVGADGVLSLHQAGDRLRLIIHNADGSRPEMCGNGIRCVGRYLAHLGAPGPYAIHTDAGLRTVHHTADDRFRVEMGAAVDLGELTAQAHTGRVMDLGNPHFVLFDQWRPEAPAQLGPGLERDPLFTEGANISFAQLTGPQRITLRVWERGCGLTEACGTGACATAAAAWLGGHADPNMPVWVDLPGGTLEIEGPAEALKMTGPATLVFSGAWG